MLLQESDGVMDEKLENWRKVQRRREMEEKKERAGVHKYFLSVLEKWDKTHRSGKREKKKKKKESRRDFQR